jgi:hypothetical protein
MNKILIALVLGFVMSGNVYAQSVKDNDLFYRCKDGTFHIRKDAVSIVSVIRENGDIYTQKFLSIVNLYTIDLSWDTVTYYTINRKNLSISNNIVNKYNKYIYKEPEFNVNAPTCIVSDLETNKRVLLAGSKKVKERYENSLKF